MSPKRFFYFMIAVLVLAAGLGVGGFILGERQLKTRSLAIADLVAERDAETKKYEQLKAVSETNLDQAQLESLIAAILPSEKQQQNLLANIIYTATAEAGIPSGHINSISFSGSGTPNDLSGATQYKEVPGVYYYPFTVVIQDISYDTLLKLFSELEKNQRIIQADQVQINPDKAQPGQLTNVTLSLKTFIKP